MEFQKLVERFIKCPTYMTNGAGMLAKRFNTSKDTIYKVKETVRSIGNKNHKKLPKILILDIETAPLKAYVWRRWKQNIYNDQLISDFFMITWSAKWLFSDKVLSAKLTSEEAINEDDSRISKLIWNLLEEADIIIAHNAEKFDVPKLNARFIVNNLPPTTYYHIIDTKKVAAKQFGFSSNKLNELAKQFGFDTKLNTDFKLWVDCLKGDDKAISYMQEYNDQDVILLEELYLKLRPWIKSHPNVGLYIDSNEKVCSNCGNTNLTQVGNYYTQVGRFKTYRCTCGAVSRVRQSDVPKDKSKGMLVSVAR